MMTPLFCGIMCLSTCLAQSMLPVRSMANTSFHCAKFISTTRAVGPPIPLLLTNISILPNAVNVSCTIRSICFSSVISVCMAFAVPPWVLISSAVSSILERVRAAITTLAPSEANAIEMALPIPFPPPVMIATLSCNLIEVRLLAIFQLFLSFEFSQGATDIILQYPRRQSFFYRLSGRSRLSMSACLQWS